MWLGMVAIAAAALAMAGCGDGGGGSGGTGGTGGTTGTTSSGGTTNTGGTTSSGGTTNTGGAGGGTMCGGFAGLQCAADEYCDFPDDLCGGADGSGVCKPRPEGCNNIYQPVCTCDGTVAGNDCDAYSQGLDVSILGGCTPPDGMFACGVGFCDKAMFYCRKTLSDVGGYPDSYECQALPAGCAGGAPTCACLADQPCSDMCAEADGGVTLTCPGG